MATLLALERFLPPFRYDQETVAGWVREWLDSTSDPEARRLLSVYARAGIKARASVVPIEQVFRPGDFEAQNERYREIVCREGAALARRALEAARLSPKDLSAIVSVSCTGFMIPAVDAFVADALGLGPLLVRLPISESGCAGGVVGLARAADYLAAHPDGAALVLALELSSLTFQRWDTSPTNVVSTAIFGDGGAAVVLVGRDHPAARGGLGRARLLDAASVFFPGTTHLMGFRLRNQGLQIVLDRELAPFVRREVAAAVQGFLEPRGLRREDVTRWILHPGGQRIIEVMADRLGLTPADLAPTEKVLAEHGNMSSVTVLFVLEEILRCGGVRAGERGLLGAFGPGFCAEFALLDFL
ncbi:MAG TPA: 3-oxoacyl-[acyl-carrier-protein] synthase III C-terminal domain-containing protein [Vicinamibacteria bacterium]|nr:3-oxoacyl-[acyl-carrier-protein] synthase III C-terminal domain-containing protein [Vicinamibacteria bacterium]